MLPIVNVLKSYKKEFLSGDIIGGLVVGVMLIPQGMAYAMIAGMPPVYGLYAAFIPQIIYALLGTSRQIAIGPVATDSIMIASGIGAVATVGTEDYIATAMLLSFLVGAMLIVMRVLRLGFLVNFLSRPVIGGFTSGAALIIILSQLKYLFGIDIPRPDNLLHFTKILILALVDINVIAIVVGISAMSIILIFKKIVPKFPALLLVVVLGIIVTKSLSLDINVVGNIPKGLPSFMMPHFEVDKIAQLFFFAGTFSLIIYMEAMAIGKSFEAKQNDYKIDANKELIALGVTNLVGSFFQSFPASAGFSRTAVNVQSGSKTGIAAIISAVVVGCVLLFFTSAFYYLPHTILAAVIIVSVVKLVDVSMMKVLWKSDKKDFYMLLFTALATLIFGILGGLIWGVGLSLIMVIYHVSHPHIAIEGRIKGTKEYRNIKRFSNLEEFDDVIIVRLDAQLFFANLNYFEDELNKIINDKGDKLKFILINAKAINGIDSSAVFGLEKLLEKYSSEGYKMMFSGVKGPVRDVLKKNGLYDVIGEDNFFLNVDNAIRKVKGEDFDGNENIVLQANNIN